MSRLQTGKTPISTISAVWGSCIPSRSSCWC